MHAKLSKKRSRRKKNKALILDEEAGEEDDVSQDEWKLGKGILLLALAAGFTLASLLVKPPWRSLGDERDKRDEWRSKEAFGGAASVAVSEDWPREEPEPFSPPSGPLSGPSVEKAVQFQKVKVLSGSSERAGSREPGNLQDPRIVWIHLHSYGGTTICDLARAHGEKVSPAKDNCNLMPDGCSTPAQFRIGCLKRLQSMQYTFTAVERSLDEEDLTCLGERRMLFGLMLRDPVAGIKSTLIGNQLEKGLMLQALRSRVVPRNLAFHFCLPPFDTYQHLDNFAVRTLSGAYDQPPGGMSMAHLERAKGDERMRNTLGGQEVVERCRKRKRVLQESRRVADVVTVEL
ncbi:unnamed protein product [Durusdinium trenchii]|uniref:Uncharacterized protein n=1 Tax=Durusdinium trenchii TaxID=1381693 RepID=A0ABP0N254_9DINO